MRSAFEKKGRSLLFLLCLPIFHCDEYARNSSPKGTTARTYLAGLCLWCAEPTRRSTAGVAMKEGGRRRLYEQRQTLECSSVRTMALHVSGTGLEDGSSAFP